MPKDTQIPEVGDTVVCWCNHPKASQVDNGELFKITGRYSLYDCYYVKPLTYSEPDTRMLWSHHFYIV